MDGCGGLLGNNHVNVHQVSLSMLLSQLAVATGALSAVFNWSTTSYAQAQYSYCRLLFLSCILFVSYVQVHIMTTPVLSACHRCERLCYKCSNSKINLKEFHQEQKLHSKWETWAILRSFGYSSLNSEPDMIWWWKPEKNILVFFPLLYVIISFLHPKKNIF